MTENESVVADDRPASQDLTCRECGVPLHYSGRGRKPTACAEHKGKSGNSPRTETRSTAGVAAAVKSLSDGYVMLSQALTFFGAPASGFALMKSVATLEEQNARLLEHDPALVKIINRGSSATGRFGFIVANASVLVPVILGGFKEITAARKSAGEA